MSKPILFRQAAFDATKDKIFDFMYSGNQAFSNTLKIYDAQNNNLVYDQNQVTFKLSHIINANSLINGKSYNAEIIAYDQNDVASPSSDKIQFKCFSTPLFSISNISQQQIVMNSSYDLEVRYSQQEGELLNEFYIVLYDINHREISKSLNLYPIDGMTYRLSSLLDNQDYFVKAFGSTVNGMLIETEEIEFSVEYINPTQFTVVSLENLKNHGAIEIQSNIVLIDGKSNPSPPIYINGEKVDITGEGHWVRYTEGFNIISDFVIEIICENIALNKTFFYLNNGNISDEITLQKRYGNFKGYDGEQNYILLNVKNNYLTYRHTSNLISKLNSNERVSIVVKRLKNLYSVSIERR